MSAGHPYGAASAAALQRLLQRCGAHPAPAAALYPEIVARYSAPSRFYHTLAHVGHVLAVVAALAAYAGDADVVRLAAWLHDLVYEPGASDNEARSAALAGEWLRALGLTGALSGEVERLILLTAAHEVDERDDDGAVLLDADLAGLGAPPPVYEAYARAIRREFAHVDEAAYRSGRAAVLRRFLARPALYQTRPMRAAYEARARQNLERELDLLTR